MRLDARSGFPAIALIVLEESVLAATGAISAALSEGVAGSILVPIAGGLLLLDSMWWRTSRRPGGTC